ncbi:major facilitator superfamily domain-containing protein [Thelonectria olida]|uniref:Major facilitator superfamily domain-containing protein n=1 Tax=Thelonectria olida TaxID=1576542 RepID=A0A9P8VQR4_9HYPO|nr:major facilitator superfamily domain-containing protein [Thelonectria olida]
MTSQDSSPPSTEKPEDQNALGWARLLFIWVGIWFAVFLYSLDQTIVSNVIPSITANFHSTSAEGWYGSGYLLTTSAFQLFYCRIYSNFSIKSGVGCAGITSGAYTIIGHVFPLRIRPLCISSIALVFAVAAVLGPVVGGIFTTHLTWRWRFYINLPLSGGTVVALLFFLPPIERPELDSVPLVEKLKKVDFIGLLIFLPTVTCLLLAVQWGGSTYAWSNDRIIALFVLFGLLAIAFIAFERWKGPEATLPMHIIAQRSVAAVAWNAFCNGTGFFLLIYYIPFWQQVVRNASAASSGIALLPFILGVVIMATLVGGLVARVGYYAPFMILASIITPIGEGLMTTWTVNTSFSRWVGYQASAGLGIGMGQQQPQVATQAVLPKADIPAGASIVVLVQTLSGAIFVAVGQAVLQNKLLQNLKTASFASGSLEISHISAAGATELRSLVPSQDLHTVLVAYNSALTQVFLIAVVMSALAILGSMLVEWKSIKPKKQQS